MSSAQRAEADVGRDGPAPIVPKHIPLFVWDLRLGSSLGLAAVPKASDVGGAARVGIDAEYWVSRNIALGAQLAFEYVSTFDFGGSYFSSHTMRGFLAPAISIRGDDPTSFPLASLALGYTLGVTDEVRACGLGADVGCVPHSSAGDSGPVASLLAAWLYHAGDVRAGNTAFALGPLIRLDSFTVDKFTDIYWTVTVGLTLGWFGVPNEATR